MCLWFFYFTSLHLPALTIESLLGRKSSSINSSSSEDIEDYKKKNGE